MKKNKMMCLTVMLTTVISILSGCSSETEKSQNVVDVEELNDYSLPEIKPIILGESNTASTAEIDDKTAQINVPNSTEYYMCTAEYSKYDTEKIKLTLLGEDKITPEKIGKEENSGYFWKKDDTHLIVYSLGPEVEFTSETSELIKNVFTKPNRQQNGDVDLFEHINEPLDFCDAEEAAKAVREKLSTIGVSVCEKADIYAFHQNDLQKIINQKCTDGNFYDPHSAFVGDDAEPLESYSVDKSQECYYIVFYEEYDGVPVYNDFVSYKTIKDLTVFHPEICAFYSADGLVGLQINEYRGNISQDEKIMQLVTPEAASEAALAKYKDVAGIEKLTFDRMELEYALQPNYIDGKLNLAKAKMQPAWVCTITISSYQTNKETGVEEIMSRKETVLIDAQTGVEII